MLREHSFKITYNTSEDDITNDFYSVALIESTEYLRGVGYFTSGWLQKNAFGLSRFISNGNTIKFITSPNLDSKDIYALGGNFDKEKIDKLVLNNIEMLEKTMQSETRNLLGWLVYDGLLEFRFAIPTNELEGGEFHDKFGIFIDANKDFLAFNGSQNDSIKATRNYESISVFKSWGDNTSATLANETLRRFRKLWTGEDENLRIYTVSEIVKNRLVKLRTSDRPYKDKIILACENHNKKVNVPEIPEHIKLRNYQEAAYDKWSKNGYKGLLSMATGSGKTITAFSSIAKLYQKNKRLAVLVVVPYQHLLEQWSEEAKSFNIGFIKCFENSNTWSSVLSNAVTSFQLIQTDQLFAIVTNSTFITKKFQTIIKSLDSLLLIVDEAHNFGSPSMIKNYLDNASYRLGLSATPDRHLDDNGSVALKNYLGGVIFEYTLEDAINSGNLTPYQYYPILVNLTADEQDEYIKLSKDIARLSRCNNGETSPQLEFMMMKRARLIASAENKIPILKKLILEKKLNRTAFNLFYCSSKVDSKDDGGLRMVDKTSSMLTEIGMSVKNFTSFDSSTKEERKTLIENLKKELIDGLVAIKCLDEGVDVPSVRRAFILSSSSNPKEFIQRRGRVLRRAEGKNEAEIYDFIVVPNEDKNNENYEYNRKFLAIELRRYREFARLAKNYPLCEIPLMEVVRKYNLEDI